ncbi:hypothetical protein LINPERHAP1_LOCUS7303 [Linum perenne]
MDHTFQRNYLHQQGAWKELWDIQLPPKTLHFIWRVAKDVLPLRSTLRRRRIAVPVECGLCGRNEETKRHIFAECEVAEDCWRHANLWGEVEELLASQTSFDEILHEILRTWNDDKKERWIVIMWSLWYERNQRVWQGKARPAGIVVEEGKAVVSEWKAARLKIPTQGRNPDQPIDGCPLWHQPLAMVLKYNVDAGFNNREQKWGWGAAIRNHNGDLVAYRTGNQRLHHPPDYDSDFPSLPDPNKKIIKCDEKLKKIFAGKDEVGFLEIAGLISPHFLK